jgi:hypothetical protein
MSVVSDKLAREIDDFRETSNFALASTTAARFALCFFARHISERLIRKSMRAGGSLSEAEPSPDRPLRQALKAVRTAHGG